MTDTTPDHVEQWQNRAEDAAEEARRTAHEGHNGYATDERQAYAAVAQVHATLAVAAEIRALSLLLEKATLDLRATWIGNGNG